MSPASPPYTQAELDTFWMRKALRLAHRAAQRGEVPVGALIVHSATNTLVSQAYNLREQLHSPLGHAELLAIHRAARKLQTWRLTGHTLYVTLEPCIMCCGGLLQSRLDRLVYGADDPKGGGAQTLFQLLSDSRLNHRIPFAPSILAEESRHLLQDFFRKLRIRESRS